MKHNKCLEYYLDSRIYSQEEVQKSIEQTRKEFPKKEIKVEVEMNSFGMYIITFYFENKNTLFNRIRIYFRKKKEKTLLLQESNLEVKKNHKNRLEKYYGHKYGKYKTTRTYKPY